MRSNQIALQSQQLSEQTGARLDRTLEQQSAFWQRLPGEVERAQMIRARGQQMAQQQERHQADMLNSSSDLALGELRRKQAAEELQWAQALHTTDMSKAQRDIAVAQAQYEQARLAKLTRDLDAPDIDRFQFSPEDVEVMNSLGFGVTFSGGRTSVTEVDPEVQKKAGESVRVKTNFARYKTPLYAAEAGEVWDSQKGDWRPGTEEEIGRVLQRAQIGNSRLTPTQDARDITALANPLRDAEQAALLRKTAAKEIYDRKKSSGTERANAKKIMDAADDDIARIKEMRDSMLRKGAANAKLDVSQGGGDEDVQQPVDDGAKQPVVDPDSDDAVMQQMNELFRSLQKMGPR